MVEKVDKFHWLQPKYWDHPDYNRDKHIKKLAENRQICSCHACCNQRRNPWAKGERITMQERKMKEYEKYDEC
jgi:hypothetical protein